jgi:hypothetical protein
MARLDELRDLKQILWDAIRGTDSGRDIAALSRQLTDVLSQIADLEKASAPREGTGLDELRARRRDRRSVAGGGARPAGG